MHPLRRSESDLSSATQTASPSKSPPTIKQQLFIVDNDLLRSTIPMSKDRPATPVQVADKKPRNDCFSRRRAEERHLRRYEHAKYSTVMFNSLGALKLFQIVCASAAIGCLWSQCRFTYYVYGYCYGPASAFQLQNFPIFVSFISIFINLVILLSWIATWEQSSPHSVDNKWKRKKVAHVDTILSFIFILLHMGGIVVEIWMIMKFNQNYSCSMCYTLALWTIAASCLIINVGLYAYNISLCLQQRRLNSIMRVRF